MIDKMRDACQKIVDGLRSEVVERALRFTESADRFTVGAAFTDRRSSAAISFWWAASLAAIACASELPSSRDADAS